MQNDFLIKLQQYRCRKAEYHLDPAGKEECNLGRFLQMKLPCTMVMTTLQGALWVSLQSGTITPSQKAPECYSWNINQVILEQSLCNAPTYITDGAFLSLISMAQKHVVIQRPGLFTCAELGRQEETSRNPGVMTEPGHMCWAVFYCQTKDFRLGQSQDFNSENNEMMPICDGGGWHLTSQPK